MSLSRREFLTTCATAGGAVVVGPRGLAAPFRVSVQADGAAEPDRSVQSPRVSAEGSAVPLVIPSTMPMGSGAPLGGIGTGFVEIRADGCFHEWQIFNAGPWAQDAKSTTAPPRQGPQYLRFLIRTRKTSEEVPQVRRLYLRSDENDLYSLPFVQDVQSIDYSAWFPMTGLEFNDATLPVRVSSQVFSPFIPGRARESATPGFHVVWTVENVSDQPVEVTLAGFLDNPLASALPERKLKNTSSQDGGRASLLFETSAEADFPSGIGNMCFSVAGGNASFISGTFAEYAMPGTCRWETPRINYMVLSVLSELLKTGRLPNTTGASDPSIGLPTEDEIDAMSSSQVRGKLEELSADALLARVFADAREATTEQGRGIDRDLLKEVRRNLVDAQGGLRLTWGTGALASTVRLERGSKIEIRFTLSWYFPHHLTVSGREMGHMYAAWYQDAAQVNQFLCEHFEDHRAATERFARTLADTSLGDPLAFAWSSQLSSLISDTWWTKDGSYAIWEGLGCCGLSTTDVDYQGSFPVVALFPELKLGQMKQTIQYQNSRGQVPHTFAGDVERVDDGFLRVDMNPQFVMMVCRDYLWTGDREYLKLMWPHVVKAMEFTASLDTDGDRLPDRDTAVQTYDQWRMRGAPAYIASLWVGALRSAVFLAKALNERDEAERWTEWLAGASSTFDSRLFNGEYYSLWIDGKLRDELCMTDQLSGEWFTSLIGLPTTISAKNLNEAIGKIFAYNFNPEFGLHNATAPRRGSGLLALNNLQAGGLWSGIEFAFASFLMEHGRFADGVKIVDAIHRRYLRAGRPWSHVECGGHYSRAMSSWTTLLAATGFKPDVPGQTLTLMPTAPGDFHAPWVTASGFGTIRQVGDELSIDCAQGELDFKRLKLRRAPKRAQLGARILKTVIHEEQGGATVEFPATATLLAGQRLTLH